MAKIVAKIGDLFDSPAQTLVNTVNCVGVMGKGIALEFKKRFPDMFEDYLRRCQDKKIKLGEPYLFKQLLPPWILNFPTKDHWRAVSNLTDIVKGLEYLKKYYRIWGIESLAVPPLGCGQGQLEWSVVGPTLYRHLKQLSIPIYLYAPFGTPGEQLKDDFLDTEDKPFSKDFSTINHSRISPAWIAIVEILARINKEPYHWAIGRTSFQKIVYFATDLGLPTELKFKRGSFGPFNPELKQMIARLNNNGLVYEEKLGQMFSIKLGRTYNDAKRIYQDDLKTWEKIINRVADLFLRLKTNDAEIAATVHFAARNLEEKLNEIPSEIDVYNEVKEWKKRRKPPLEEKEIGLTIRNLNALHWLNLKPSSDLPLPESPF